MGSALDNLFSSHIIKNQNLSSSSILLEILTSFYHYSYLDLVLEKSSSSLVVIFGRIEKLELVVKNHYSLMSDIVRQSKIERPPY